MRRLFFIVDEDGIIVSNVYKSKANLIHDYSVESDETVVELNYEDMVTDKQKESPPQLFFKNRPSGFLEI